MLTVTLVIPCYNEAARLPVDRFQAFLADTPNVSLVLVNDGSRDATADVLERVRQGYESRVRVVNRPENRGKGESVREGLLQALNAPLGGTVSDVVGFWDADLATPFDAVSDLMGILETQAQVQMVFGARVNLLGRRIIRKALRHYLGRIFATTISIMLRLPVYDTQCGAKLFRATPELQRILSEGPFITRWVFDVELIARWIRLNNFDMPRVRQTIYEFPLLVWEDIDGSKVKPHDFLKAFLDVVRIYLRYFL